MAKRESWEEWSRHLDWEFSYVSCEEVFPPDPSGQPFLPHSEWQDWDEPYRTTFSEYVTGQSEKESSVAAVRQALSHPEDTKSLPAPWLDAMKLHFAALPLAEFAAAVGNLRGARFGRDSAWRSAATLGALDEMRHTQIPLLIGQELVKHSPQFDWTHKFYHSNNWVAIAARHFFDEMLLGANAIEFAIATHFVFETGFTNLQFIGLTSLAHGVKDRMLETMLGSIQTDEARHAQIGPPVLATICRHDPAYAQKLLDKWFWRSWHLFAILTGFTMDYLTPLEHRTASFREFMEEWVIEQYVQTLSQYGLEKPWYWDQFRSSMLHYHHMVYASAYTYRSSVWFDFVLPGPRERAWLRQKYPESWDQMDPIWERISDKWRAADVGNDYGVHGTAIVGFCDLCQLVLCEGTPKENAARVLDHRGRRYIFCSEPCQVIFEREPERYETHKDVVKRVLAGEAPANLLALLRQYFGLDESTWGRDAFRGVYGWLQRVPK